MKKNIITLGLLIASTTAFSQVGIGTATPNKSAQLEVVSSNKGVLLPKVALTDANDNTTIANGNVEGLIVYNTSNSNGLTPGFYYYSGASWERLLNQTSDHDTKTVSLKVVGSELVLTDSANAEFKVQLSDLAKAETQTTLENKILTENKIVYTNEAGVSTEIDFSKYLDNQNTKIQEVKIEGGFLKIVDTDGVTKQVSLASLQAGADSFISHGKVENGKLILAKNSAYTSGKIEVTLPVYTAADATIEINAANRTIKRAALTGDVSNTETDRNKLKVTGLQGRKVAETPAPTNGQVLKWNGTAWAPADDIDTNTNTTYQAGEGIVINSSIVSLDTHTGDVTGKKQLTIGAGKVTADKIGNNAVTEAKIANNAVTTAKIKNASVTAEKLHQMNATSGQVLKWNGNAWAPAADNNSNTTYTADNASIKLTGTTFKRGALTGDVTSAEGTTATTVVKLQGKDVSNVAPANGQVLTWNGTTNKWEAKALPAGTVDTNNYVKSGVVQGNTLKLTLEGKTQTVDITLPADKDTKYTAGTGLTLSGTQFSLTPHTGDVTGTTALTIANNAVTEVKIANDAVTTAKIKNLQVTETKLANDAVTTAKIKNSQVTEAKLANDAVTTAKIKNGAVTAEKLDKMNATNGQVLTWDNATNKWKPASLNSVPQDKHLSSGTVSGNTLNLTVTNGTAVAVSLPTANGTTLGLAKAEANSAVSATSGALDVKVDGTTITKDATGKLKLVKDNNTTYTGTAPINVVQPQGNSTQGTISVATANGTTLGVVKAENNKTVSITNGVVDVKVKANNNTLTKESNGELVVKEQFYMPNLVLPTDDASYNESPYKAVGAVTKEGNKYVVKLHDIYKRQFGGEDATTFVKSSTSANLRKYNATDMDYFITYYDKSVFTNVTLDANGVLKYQVSTNPVTINSYMTIVFQVK